MQSSIMQVYQGQLKIGTWDISQGSKIQHRLLKKIIETHPDHFPEDETPKLKRWTQKRGGQVDEYLLSEKKTRILFAHLLNHERMKMGLCTCIFKQFESETEFFKLLEEYFEFAKDL